MYVAIHHGHGKRLYNVSHNHIRRIVRMHKYLTLLLLLLPLPASAVDQIAVLALFRDKVILEIDGKQQTLTVGQLTSSGVKLISATSKEAVLEIDGKQQAYTLGQHIGSNFSGAEAGSIVSIAPDSQGMYLVNGSINKHLVRFVVDTGATLISMNRNEAIRFGIDYKKTGQRSTVITASGKDTVYLINLESVRVGDIALNNIAAAVHDNDYPQHILLGNSFLNNVSIKREGQLLQLAK